LLVIIGLESSLIVILTSKNAITMRVAGYNLRQNGFP